MRKLLFVVGILCCSIGPAFAQSIPQSQSWFPQGRAALSASSVTSNVQLPTSGLIAKVCNVGPADAFLALGTDNTITASATTNYQIRSGVCQAYSLIPFGSAPRYTYLAGITSGTQTTSLYVETGSGFPGVQLQQTGGSANQISSTPTIQNAAYVSGNCVGGFNAVTVTTYNGQSAYLINTRVVSLGGGTETLTLYIFSANPTASTCTDRSTFALNSADVDKLITNPVGTSVTLSAPTGTTITFGSAELSPPRPFRAGGIASSGVSTIYYALVSGSSFTPATTSDLHVTFGVARD